MSWGVVMVVYVEYFFPVGWYFNNSMDRRHVFLPCSVTVDTVCHQLHHSSDAMLTVWLHLSLLRKGVKDFFAFLLPSFSCSPSEISCANKTDLSFFQSSCKDILLGGGGTAALKLCHLWCMCSQFQPLWDMERSSCASLHPPSQEQLGQIICVPIQKCVCGVCVPAC